MALVLLTHTVYCMNSNILPLFVFFAVEKRRPATSRKLIRINVTLSVQSSMQGSSSASCLRNSCGNFGLVYLQTICDKTASDR